jgi:hypothetical protein
MNYIKQKSVFTTERKKTDGRTAGGPTVDGYES